MTTLQNELLERTIRLLANIPVDQLINWSNVSHEPNLPEGIIDDFHNFLDWNVLSKHYAFQPWLVGKYKEKINFRDLSKNPNLPANTIVAYADKMDIDRSQRYHKYTDDMVLSWRDDLDPNTVLRYQNVKATTVKALLEPFVQREQWSLFKVSISYAVINQTLTVEFFDWLLELEQKLNIPVPESTQPQNIPKICLFNRDELMLYQTHLSYEWVYNNIVTDDSTKVAFIENFTVPDIITLKYIVHYQNLISIDRLLFKQTVRESILYWCLEFKPDQSTSFLNAIVQIQRFDFEFLEHSIAKYMGTADTSMLYLTVFNRNLNPTLPTYLGWNQTVMNSLCKKINMVNLAMNPWNEALPDFLTYLLANYDQFPQFSWYKFLIINSLNDQTLSVLLNSDVLKPLEVWFALVKNKKKLSSQVLTQYEQQVNWWKYVPYATIFEQIDEFTTDFDQPDTDVAILLSTFVKNTNWTDFLREEILPEWFIECFARYRTQIESKTNGVSYWWKIGRYQKLSPAFIDVHINDLELRNILVWQVLNIDQLERYSQWFDAECWNYVLRYQQTTPGFITSHKSALDAINDLKPEQVLTEQVLMEQVLTEQVKSDIPA